MQGDGVLDTGGGGMGEGREAGAAMGARFTCSSPCHPDALDYPSCMGLHCAAGTKQHPINPSPQRRSGMRARAAHGQW